MAQVCIRKARTTDVRAIRALLMRKDHQALVLPRSLNQICSHLRDFLVAEADGEVVGCVALAITWEDLAEIRSLVVAPARRKAGLGRILVNAALDEARDLGIHTVFTLTEVPDFFTRMGFFTIEKDGLNQAKIWADCLNCPRYPDHCNEVAMTIHL